jgi:hypothetical protein
MSEWWQEIASAAMIGMLAGQLLTRWLINGYYAGKRPDGVSHRTGIFIKGSMYYLVTEREYVNKVLAPLPDGSRVEIGDNFVRFTNMPPRQQ